MRTYFVARMTRPLRGGGTWTGVATPPRGTVIRAKQDPKIGRVKFPGGNVSSLCRIPLKNFIKSVDKKKPALYTTHKVFVRAPTTVMVCQMAHRLFLEPQCLFTKRSWWVHSMLTLCCLSGILALISVTCRRFL